MTKTFATKVPNLAHASRSCFRLCGLAIAIAALAAGQNILTYQNNVSRTGANLSETILTPANVNATSFGNLFSYTLDGLPFAQPLYMAGVPIAGKGRHNVVFVATVGDSVYALDADSNAGANATPLWQWTIANPPNVIPIPASLSGGPNEFFNCGSFGTTVGIVGTPVIDPNTLTIYFVTVTKETTDGNINYVHRFHAVDITTGLSKSGSGSIITAPAGTDYYAHWMVQRTGLLLLNGNVYLGFSAPCDHAPFQGMLASFNAQTLQQNPAVFITDHAWPGQGGIWGGAPAADAAGNIFVMTGNGDFNPSSSDYGSAFLKLNQSFQVQDYFAPYNINGFLNSHDDDLGTSMPILLPDSVGSTAHPHLMVGAGKEGRIYLIDRDNLGGYDGISDHMAGSYMTGHPIFGRGAYFNNYFYTSPGSSPLLSFNVSGAQLSLGSTTSNTFTNGSAYIGAGINISANGTSNGIVWTLPLISGSAVLNAYDATNLQNQLYTTAGSSDALGGWVNLSLPSTAQGKVFAGNASGAQGVLSVFGLRSPVCATDASSQITVARGGWRYNHATNTYMQTITLTNKGTALTGPVTLVLDNLTSTSQLVSGAGTTTCGSATGSFYQNANLIANGLAPGESTQIYLSASNSSTQTITFTTRVLAGTGVR